MHWRLLSLLLFTVFLGKCPAAVPTGTRYIMSHFKNDGGGGDERLYISVSPDGLNWTALNNGNPVYQPVNYQPYYNLVRDPSIIYANGAYWVVHTSGNYGLHESFGLLRSTDLIHWTFQQEINVAQPGNTDPTTWSPLFFRDGDGSVHVFVTLKPADATGFQLRVHEVHPLNAEWTQWSAPVLVGLPGTSNNELWVWKEGPTYHAVYVDFTRNGGYVHVTSSSLLTGWSNLKFLGFNSQEGGFVLRKPDGGYRFYAETGNNGPSPNYLYADCDANFANFTPQQPVTSTVGMRNGKPIAAVDGTSYDDWSSEKLGSVAAAGRLPEADPDGDRLVNLAEFATGANPVTRNDSPLKFINGLLQFHQGNGAQATVETQISADLRTWYAEAGHLETVSVNLRTDGVEEVTMRDISPLPGGKHFYRLRAAATLAGEASGAAAPMSQMAAPAGTKSQSARVVASPQQGAASKKVSAPAPRASVPVSTAKSAPAPKAAPARPSVARQVKVLQQPRRLQQPLLPRGQSLHFD